MKVSELIWELKSQPDDSQVFVAFKDLTGEWKSHMKPIEDMGDAEGTLRGKVVLIYKK